MRIWEKLKNKPFCNEFHFLWVFFVLVLLSVRHHWMLICLGIYLIFIIRKTSLWIPCLILGMLFGVSYFLNRNSNPVAEGRYEGTFLVVERNAKQTVFKEKFQVIVFQTEEAFEVGDEVKATLELSLFETASFAGDFDSQAYYESKGISCQGRIIDYRIVKHHRTLSALKGKILEFYAEHIGPTSFLYLKSFLFAESDFPTDLKETFSVLSILHLFAISGFHFYFFFRLFLWIFRRIFRIEGSAISLFLLGVYLAFLSFPLSACRAYLFLVLRFFNQKGTVRYTRLDLYSICFILMGLSCPLQCYQNGFILSFGCSFLMIYADEFFSTAGKFKSIGLSFLCILFSVPFVSNQNHEIYWVGILFSCLFGSFFGILILVAVLFQLWIPLPFFEVFFSGLNQFFYQLAHLQPTWNISYFSFEKIVIYEICFVFLLICLARKKKIFLGFGILLGIVAALESFPYLDDTAKVTFLDVGQGDSTLIELKKRKAVILIDTYGDSVNYLKSIGIRKIDGLILTHFDRDHIGNVEELLKSFSIMKIYYSAYEDLSRLPPSVPLNDLIPLSANQTIEIGSVFFSVLSPFEKADDPNDCSVVVRFQIQNTKFLMMGDASTSIEEALVRKYSTLLKSDILKVGHHGSDTSSGEAFLNVVRPKYSMISVGKKNSYHLPSNEVVWRLQRYSEIYMTKDCGNITVLCKDNQMAISPYRHG